MQFIKLEINLQLFYWELALWPWARDWQVDRKAALAAATKKIYFNSPELWALKNLSNKFNSVNFRNFLKFSNHLLPDLIRNCHYQLVPHPFPCLDPWCRHTAGPTLPFFGPCLHPHLAFSTACSSPQSFTHQELMVEGFSEAILLSNHARCQDWKIPEICTQMCKSFFGSWNKSLYAKSVFIFQIWLTGLFIHMKWKSVNRMVWQYTYPSWGIAFRQRKEFILDLLVLGLFIYLSTFKTFWK